MIKTLSKKYPQTFKILLKVSNPFDVNWIDWDYVTFLISTGMEITMHKKGYKLRHKDTIVTGSSKSTPLEEMIEAGFKILEQYIIKNIQHENTLI